MGHRPLPKRIRSAFICNPDLLLIVRPAFRAIALWTNLPACPVRAYCSPRHPLPLCVSGQSDTVTAEIHDDTRLVSSVKTFWPAISRDKFLDWFINREPCLVAMEACSASHFRARRLRALGHDVWLLAPQFAAPYRKGGARVKNDALDAEAICEAASRPHMRFVAVKTPEQPSVLVLHASRRVSWSSARPL